jgi:outer membrane protein assembly factor BamB
MRLGTLVVSLCLLVADLLGGNWPAWRGLDGNGISSERGFPLQWSNQENVRWRVPLSGLGTSTPVVWGDLVILTMQLGDGPFEGRSRDFAGAANARRTGQQHKVQFAVQAFRRDDGKLAWEYVFDAKGPLHPVHIKHNLASPSCVTDGQLVYAWMGTGQLVALTMEGKLAWQKDLTEELGPFEILWGHGSSPVLYKDSLILLCDHQSRAYLLALDKRDGKRKWLVDRGKERRSYATPLIVPGRNGDEMIINTSERIEALDPATGQLLWYAAEPNRVPVPTPVFHDGVLYASRGYNSGPYMALKTSGRGNVSESHTVWKVNTGAPYVSSLLYYRGLIWMATEGGIVSCVDAATGKTLWKERFGGVFSASPVAAEGRVYLINEDGDAWVLEAGREMKILAKNSLGERTLASPALAGGRIYLRTDESLFCIGSR